MRGIPAELRTTRQKKTLEDDLQMALVEHLQLRAKPGVVFYMIPNGLWTSKMQGARAKKMGLRRGASDMGFIIPPAGLAAMLELKAEGMPSDEQQQFGEDVEAAGGLFAVAWGIDQALAILVAWGAIHPEAEF